MNDTSKIEYRISQLLIELSKSDDINNHLKSKYITLSKAFKYNNANTLKRLADTIYFQHYRNSDGIPKASKEILDIISYMDDDLIYNKNSWVFIRQMIGLNMYFIKLKKDENKLKSLREIIYNSDSEAKFGIFLPNDFNINTDLEKVRKNLLNTSDYYNEIKLKIAQAKAFEDYLLWTDYLYRNIIYLLIYDESLEEEDVRWLKNEEINTLSNIRKLLYNYSNK